MLFCSLGSLQNITIVDGNALNSLTLYYLSPKYFRWCVKRFSGYLKVVMTTSFCRGIVGTRIVEISVFSFDMNIIVRAPIYTVWP